MPVTCALSHNALQFTARSTISRVTVENAALNSTELKSVDKLFPHVNTSIFFSPFNQRLDKQYPHFFFFFFLTGDKGRRRNGKTFAAKTINRKKHIPISLNMVSNS